MGKHDVTKKMVDEIIRFGALGAAITAVAVAPNIAQVLAGPVVKLSRKLDEREEKRQNEREAQRVIRYMKQQGLLAGSYEHGLQLTRKAQNRLERVEIDSLSVLPTLDWDGLWRIVMYDIPEEKRGSRHAFWSRLHQIGCFQLQKSIWITPFACRNEVATLAARYGVDEYVSYFEAINIDNEKVLLQRFKNKYPDTNFSQHSRHHHAMAS